MLLLRSLLAPGGTSAVRDTGGSLVWAGKGTFVLVVHILLVVHGGLVYD